MGLVFNKADNLIAIQSGEWIMSDHTNAWVCVRRQNKNNYHLQGVFIDKDPKIAERLAVASCLDETYYIGPIPVNVSLPEAEVNWHGAYCPNKMKKIIISFVLMLSVFMMGCPVSKQTIEKLDNASEQFSKYAEQGINITDVLLDEGVLKPEEVNQIADMFIYLSKGGQQFDKRVSEIKTYFENSADKPDKATVKRLSEYFRTDVIQRFLDAVDFIKQLSSNAKLNDILSKIKIAIIVVAEVLGIESATRVDLAGV